MDRFEKELMEQLAGDPLVRNGFDERLRRRIEERIREPRRAPRRFSAIAAFAGAGALLIAAVWIGVWRLSANTGSLAYEQISGPAEQALHVSAHQPSAQMAGEEPAIRSALLIGIRADEPDSAGPGVVGVYRSLLVAPENGVLQVVAQGSDILMPYGREFWKIRSVRDPDGSPRLVAAPAATLEATATAKEPADGTATDKRVDEAAESGAEPERIYEQVLFAGNRYISVRQERFDGDRETDSREFLWVKHVEQLTPKLLEGTGDGEEGEPHVALSDVLTDATEAKLEQWAIVREPGRWAIRYPDERSEEGEARPWRTYPATLPSSVVSHDRLDLSWEEIARLDPLAKDAYTSPAQDVLALVRDDGIRVVPYRLPDAAARSVFVPMDNDETIIMVQWALDRYVEEWKRQAALWLTPGTSSPQ